MKISFCEVFLDNLYSQSCLYKMYACTIEWRLEKSEAWFYLSSLLKSLRILGQHQKCKFCMDNHRVLPILQTETPEYRLRTNPSSNWITRDGKEILQLPDWVTQPWTGSFIYFRNIFRGACLYLLDLSIILPRKLVMTTGISKFHPHSLISSQALYLSRNFAKGVYSKCWNQIKLCQVSI